MKKVVLLGTYLLLLLLTIHHAFHLTIISNLNTSDWISPSTKEIEQKNEFRGKIKLEQQEIEKLNNQIHQQLSHLKQINLNLKLAALIIAILIFVFTLKMRWEINAFDGLYLLLFTLFLWVIPYLLGYLADYLIEFHNANIDFIIFLIITILVLQPILFYWAYKSNQLEINKKLHTNSFISKIALFMCILALLLLTIFGIGILITPDLSGNIS